MSTSQHERERKNARSVIYTSAQNVNVNLSGGQGQTEGMIRQPAIVDKSPSICGTLMRAQPRSGSAVHHHGEQDTIVYAVSGTGSIVTRDEQGEEKHQTLQAGDWALIPAYREHKEVNESDVEVVWVIVRAPVGTPVVVNLSGWEGVEV